MEDELLLWNESVKKQRENFYELSYYTTLQLLALRKEFGRINERADVSPDVLALLQSISTEVTPSIVSNALYCTAEATIEDISDSREGSVETEKLSDVVSLGVGTSLQAAVEEVVVDEDKHTPTLTEDELSENRKAIMANITSRLECSKKLVLIAFEKCPDSSEQYDYERWCTENMDAYESDQDQDGDEESDYDDESSTSKSESADLSFKYSPGNL